MRYKCSLSALLCSWRRWQRESRECPGSASCRGWWNDSKHRRHLKWLLGVKTPCIITDTVWVIIYPTRTLEFPVTASRYFTQSSSRAWERPDCVSHPDHLQSGPKSWGSSSFRLWSECEVVDTLRTGAIGGALPEDGGQCARLMLGGRDCFEMPAHFSCFCQEEHFRKRFNAIFERVGLPLPEARPLLTWRPVRENRSLKYFSAPLCNNGFSLYQHRTANDVELLSFLLLQHQDKVKVNRRLENY